MMAIRVGLVALVLLAGAGGLLRRAAPAQACSADEQWDPVAQSEVIVGGRIEGYTPLPDRSPVGMFIPVRLEMRIDHVWKGSLRPGTEIIDRASFRLQTVFTDKEEIRIAWAGSASACGALNDDPSGQYAVFGLFAAPDGSLQTTSLRTFYLSPQPYDPATIARLSQRIAFPVAGAGEDTTGARNLVEALLAGGAALFVAGIVWRNRVRPDRAGGQV
jgi:hypothetical protein